jgi:aromatic-amino-acid transaminase
MSASLLAGVEMAPRDPIIGISELFNADTNPKKVNLGIGVYTDDAGKVPLLECVRRADRAILDNPALPCRGSCSAPNRQW